MIPQGKQRVRSGHESKDADVLGVVAVAALVLLLLAISFLAAMGMLRFASRKDKSTRPPSPSVRFPQPRLQTHPAADYVAAQEVRKAELHSYGWVDRNAGVAHIPIERAMELLLEHGLPEVGAGQTRLQLMQARPATDAPPNKPIEVPQS